MEKIDTFLLIHNYNTIPEKLADYAKDYLIVDASDNQDTVNELRERGMNFIHVQNTGHNITSYFSFFTEHYNDIPSVMCICKGNMIGRHCSQEYFDRVCHNTWFTYLYEEKAARERYSKPSVEVLRANHGKDPNADCIASIVSESQYIEKNTSWYAQSENHPNRYFDDYDDLLKFVYKDPVIPKYILFAPGACYIVEREQIKKHTPVFYSNMNLIMNYGLEPSFPSEAHMVERMLPTIFEAAYEENQWMNDKEMFLQKLEERENIMTEKKAADAVHFRRLRRMFSTDRSSI